MNHEQSSLNRQHLWAYLQLLRPANIITAWADILAGFAVATSTTNLINLQPLLWLLLATTGLYGGGIVLNDVFDAKIDTQERPERPIPSGRASLRTAAILGSSLLSLGIVAASQVSWLSATLACAIALAAVIYDAFGKHHPVLGPINMGLCRGGNLLLGVSAMPALVKEHWFLALIGIIYIGAITVLSRGEVHGGKNSTGVLALLLIYTVITGLFSLGLLNNYQVLVALPFIILFAALVSLPVIKAVYEPTPEKIRVAVRLGVLSIVVLDATLAAGFGSLFYGFIVLSLLPLSVVMSQIFAVT
jgi:4-hydroxybenzoate polyprenyltransferase